MANVSTEIGKSVIVYLVRNTKQDISNLIKSLKSLDLYFNKEYQYPVLLFHENLTHQQIYFIKSNTTSRLKFELIEFKTQSFIKNIPEYVYINGFGFSVGYRHMCRFFASELYKHPTMKQYEYYLRLDTDSFLHGNIGYDIFKFMHENNILYGYIDSGIDTAPNDELRQLTEQYATDHNIKHKRWDGSAYGTNFEISNLNFWQSKECMGLLNHIDATGGIYKHRWGDHIIHFIAVSMFLQPRQTHKFTDIMYQHQDVYYNCSVDYKIFQRLKKRVSSVCWRTLLKMSTCFKRKSKRYKAYRDRKNNV